MKKTLPIKSSFKRSLLLKLSLFAILVFLNPVHSVRAEEYYSSGTFTSTNLLSNVGAKTIDKFGYNISSLPAGTIITVRFSQDSVTWRNSSGTVSAWDTLSSGNHLAEGDAINLSALNWVGDNFYYQIQIDTTDPAATPLLDEVVVFYSPGIYILTQNVTNGIPTQVTGNANISGISGGNATIRGFKYGLTQTDTWDVHEDGDFGAGTYSLNLTGLSANTSYYIRGYAVNPEGISYGSWVSFTTSIYSPTATIISTNLLSGETVTTIDEFDYTLSAKPEGTGATVQFSQNSSTWYNSSGTLNGTDILTLGTSPINLKLLNWTGANFYYKIVLTANATGDATPVLDDINVVVNSATSATVAEYRFDEGNGIIIHNTGTGGSTLNGTITSSTWDNNGKFGKALSFNGSSSYVTIATPITGIRTVSFWVKPTSTSTNLIDFDGGTHTVTATTGVISANGFTTPVIYVNGVRGAALAANSWQHILITTTYASAFDSTTITLGKISSNYFSGSMDQLKIFNYAMSPAQVKVDYNQSLSRSLGSSGSSTSSYCPPGESSCVAPVAEWTFDEGSGSTVADSSGNSNTGTWSGTGSHWVNGKFGKAGKFNGSDDYVGVANTVSANTVSFWVKPTTNAASMVNLTATQYITASGGTVSATNFSTPTIYVNGTVDGTLLANTWNFVAVTTATTISANAITLGKANSAYTTGQIDQLQIYNYARTPAQIAWDYNRGAPLAHWRFDETSGLVANDSSGNLQTGTITAANFVAGRANNALSFNGTTSFVSAAVNKSVNAVSFWMIQNNTSNKSIIDLGGGYTVTVASNTITTTGFSSPIVYIDGKAGNAITDTNWHHISVTSATAFTASTVTIGKVATAFFPGMIDEVKLFNYPLTAAQVKLLYNDNFAYQVKAPAAVTYLLYDQFTTDRAAGAVNGTQAEPTGGVRTVVDTGNVLSISGGKLTLAGGISKFFHPIVTRTSGRTLLGKITNTGSQRFYYGFGVNQVSAATTNSFRLRSTSLRAVDAAIEPEAGVINTDIEYDIAIVLRNTGAYYYIKGGTYTNWTLVWIGSISTAVDLYPGFVGYDSNTSGTLDNIRIPTSTWLPTPLAYDTFSTAGSTVTERTGPDSQVTPQVAWTNGTKSGGVMSISPTLGSELLINGNMETGNPPANWIADGANTITGVADQRTGGVGAQSISVVNGVGSWDSAKSDRFTTGGLAKWVMLTGWGRKATNSNPQLKLLDNSSSTVGWTVITTGTSWTYGVATGRMNNVDPYGYASLFNSTTVNLDESRYDDISAKVLTLSTLFASVPVGTPNVVADVTIPAYTLGTQAGLVIGLDSASSPANFLIAYLDGTGKATVAQNLAGTYTTIVTAATATWNASYVLRVIKDGTAVRLYYNNVLIGTGTCSASITGTRAGLFSTYASNTFDNFTVFARGSGNEYNALNSY